MSFLLMQKQIWSFWGGPSSQEIAITFIKTKYYKHLAYNP